MRLQLLVTFIWILSAALAVPARAQTPIYNDQSEVEVSPDQAADVQSFFDSLSGGGGDSSTPAPGPVSDEQGPSDGAQAAPTPQPKAPVEKPKPKPQQPKPVVQQPAPKPTVTPPVVTKTPAQPSPYVQCPNKIKDYAPVAAMIRGVLGFNPSGVELAEDPNNIRSSDTGQVHIRLINDHGSATLWEGKSGCSPGAGLFCSKSQPGLFCQTKSGQIQVTANDGGKLVTTYITHKSGPIFFISGTQDHSHDNNFTLTQTAQ